MQYSVDTERVGAIVLKAGLDVESYLVHVAGDRFQNMNDLTQATTIVASQ